MFKCPDCKEVLVFQKKIDEDWYMHLCPAEDRIFVYHRGGFYRETDQARTLRKGGK